MPPLSQARSPHQGDVLAYAQAHARGQPIGGTAPERA